MGGGFDTVALYTVLLAASLWLNGVCTVGSRPLTELFRPLQSPRLLGGSLLIDVIVVPAAVLTAAWFVSDITSEVRVGLVMIAAASTGPIGSVLTRMVRGDLPLATSLVTAFGALNLLTVPLLGMLLLRNTVPFPLGPVVTSMLLLVIAPLIIGYLWELVNKKRQLDPKRKHRQLQQVGKASSVLLVAAIAVALTFDADRVFAMLFGPVGLVSWITMTGIVGAACLVGRTAIERMTLSIVLNARGAGLSLTVVALHFAHLTDARAAVLTFSLVTQIVPTVIMAITKRFIVMPKHDA